MTCLTLSEITSPFPSLWKTCLPALGAKNRWNCCSKKFFSHSQKVRGSITTWTLSLEQAGANYAIISLPGERDCGLCEVLQSLMEPSDRDQRYFTKMTHET